MVAGAVNEEPAVGLVIVALGARLPPPCDADGDAEADGLPPTLPVHVVPLSFRLAPSGFAPLQLPRNPNEIAPFVATLAFQLRFVASTCSPVCVLLAFQIWVIVWDELPKSHPTVQLVIGSPRFVTSTWAWKPPAH